MDRRLLAADFTMVRFAPEAVNPAKLPETKKDLV
jgi:hypothetical protein